MVEQLLLLWLASLLATSAHCLLLSVGRMGGLMTDTLVVVAAFSSNARILTECSTVHSLPAPFFFSFFFIKRRLVCTY